MARSLTPKDTLNDVQLTFTDYALQLTPARGVRGWHVDDYGRLIGMVYREVWKPGENAAVCHGYDRVRNCKMHGVDSPPGHTYSDYIAAHCSCPMTMLKSGDWSNNPKIRPGHKIHECFSGHGFYAYHDGVMDYVAPQRGRPHVTGVIEGYGDAVIGSRGFRCEKARVVALCTRPRGVPLRTLWKSVPFRFFVALLALFVVDLAAAIATSTWVVFWSSFYAPLIVATMVSCVCGLHRTIRSALPARSRVDPARLRTLYPDARVFTSERRMLREFPPDRQLKPGQSDPSQDPEFWSRPVK
jgi:hypothetical protein